MASSSPSHTKQFTHKSARRQRMRSDAALHRAGPGLDSTAKTEPVAPEPVVTLVKVTKSLRSASLTISLSCSHLRPKANPMRVSVSAGRSGREGCVPAAQSRRMPERTLGLLLTSEGWWVGLGSKAAHEAKDATR